MLEIEVQLLDEYKVVDNICRDIFLSQSGINQYISVMEQNFSHGRSVISSWNDDYYKLKHIRWLRNKIAHESSATDCTEEDTAWLIDFHNRLLKQQDPLALLRTANWERSNYPRMNKSSQRTVSEQWAVGNANLQDKKESSPNNLGVMLIIFVEILIILAALAVLLIYVAN